jgi:hypothetical protein
LFAILAGRRHFIKRGDARSPLTGRAKVSHDQICSPAALAAAFVVALAMPAWAGDIIQEWASVKAPPVLARR